VNKGPDGPELTEIKADKYLLALNKKTAKKRLLILLTLLKRIKEILFIFFTDGYADQFGGGRDKKYSTGKFKELIKANSIHDFAIQEKKIKQEHLNWKADNETSR